MKRRRRQYRDAKVSTRGWDWGGVEGCPLHSRLGGLEERRELPLPAPPRTRLGELPEPVHALGARKCNTSA